ncbi:9214_t:CDS:2 [Dentiscutata erythropus]|uniref:9214_t:CDS:1 n=1 Tax=Dentiscutata erythropus TaxID=1348616 RepID=A0A9N9BGQ0_9GLOM|nr:9214_t:CDS:2 [Dentiscutata erythropus]
MTSESRHLITREKIIVLRISSKRHKTNTRVQPTLDLANFPVTETLKMLASLLEKITHANDHLKSTHNNINHSESTSSSVTATSTPSFTRFHARSVPSIDIHSYLSRILKYCPTTNECFLSLLVYFDRMSKNASATSSGKAFSIDSFNIHRLIIAGIMVSSKFFSDVFFTNSRYAKVGGLPVSELNQLELEFLVLNDFRLAISVEELQRYGDQLLKHWVLEEEMKQGGGIYDNMRFQNSSGSLRWDSGHNHDKNTQTKRTRRLHSNDDTNISRGGSKTLKDDDQLDNGYYFGRSHRRDNSFSSSKSLNIPYQSSLTSSPQPYTTHISKTPPPPSLCGSSPSFASTSSGSLPISSSINGSPMHAPFASSSILGGSTIKRANSSSSLFNRARDLSDDLQYSRRSSPKSINPEDHAYRTAAASPYYSAPSIPTTSTTSMNNNNSRGVPQPPTLVTPSPTRNIGNFMRRMSHDSPANTSQYPPSAYHYTGYPPQSSTQSLPTTPVTTLPSIQGISYPSIISNAAHSTVTAALNYARRASLALPPLPRNLSGIPNGNVPSPVSTVAPDNLGPGLVRRGSVPAWKPRISSSNLVMSNGSSSTSVSSNPAVINGRHANGIGNIFNKFTKRGSWVIVNHPQSNTNHGHYNHNHHAHQINHQHGKLNKHGYYHPQSHDYGNVSRSSSSDSSHSSSTTGSGSASDTSGGSGIESSIPASRTTKNGNDNSNINGPNKTLKN